MFVSDAFVSDFTYFESSAGQTGTSSFKFLNPSADRADTIIIHYSLFILHYSFSKNTEGDKDDPDKD
jgi:hypothetical protein